MEHDALVYKVAKKFRQHLHGYDLEDLMQEGRLAVIRAQETYCPEKGSFVNWAYPIIQNAIMRMLHIVCRDGEYTQPPPVSSLEAPLVEDESLCLLDTLEDENAVSPAENAEYEDLKSQVWAAVHKLEEKEQVVAVNVFMQGKPLLAVCREHGMKSWQGQRASVTAKRKLRISLRSFHDDQPNYYRRKGVEAFQRSGSSAVEDIALQRIV